MMKNLERQIKASVLGEMDPEKEECLRALLDARPQSRQKWMNLKRIAGLLRTDPLVDPPANFTERLMDRIADLPDHQPETARIKTTGPLDRVIRNLTRASSWNECFYVFFITGFFFLIIGFSLLWGYRPLVSGAELHGWMANQPQVNMGLGTWLLVLSLMMRMESKERLGMVRTGTVLFMSLAMLNGLALLILNGFPLAVGGGLAYMMGGLILGIYLSSVLAGFRKRLAEV